MRLLSPSGSSPRTHGSSLSLRDWSTPGGTPTALPPSATPYAQRDRSAPKGRLVQEVPRNGLGPEPQDEQGGQEAGVQEEPGGKGAESVGMGTHPMPHVTAAWAGLLTW